MGLFKSGKSKADDLLSILIPSLQWQMQEELKKRLVAQMEDIVREAANQIIGYGYDEAIKELTVQVRAPKRQWVGLTDEQLSKTYNELYTQYTRDDVNIADFILIARTIESQLKELNT